MQGLTHVIKTSVSNSIQRIEIWYDLTETWLDLQDSVTDALDRLGTALVVKVDYSRDFGRDDTPVADADLPVWGRCCIFCFGWKPGNIASDVFRVVREEWEALESEIILGRT